MMEETDIKNEIVGLSNSLSLLGSLPDSCLVCSKPYDNTDEKMFGMQRQTTITTMGMHRRITGTRSA